MRKPGASSVTLSPWLIHTWCDSPSAHSPSNRTHESRISMKAWPNSPLSPRSTPPPSCACIDCRSEEHTSELQSLMRISYAVFCLKKKKNIKDNLHSNTSTQQ